MDKMDIADILNNMNVDDQNIHNMLETLHHRVPKVKSSITNDDNLNESSTINRPVDPTGSVSSSDNGDGADYNNATDYTGGDNVTNDNSTNTNGDTTNKTDNEYINTQYLPVSSPIPTSSATLPLPARPSNTKTTLQNTSNEHHQKHIVVKNEKNTKSGKQVNRQSNQSSNQPRVRFGPNTTFSTNHITHNKKINTDIDNDNDDDDDDDNNKGQSSDQKSHLTTFFGYSIPTSTLYFIIVLVLIAIGLYFLTAEKKKDKEKDKIRNKDKDKESDQ